MVRQMRTGTGTGMRHSNQSRLFQHCIFCKVPGTVHARIMSHTMVSPLAGVVIPYNMVGLFSQQAGQAHQELASAENLRTRYSKSEQAKRTRYERIDDIKLVIGGFGPHPKQILRTKITTMFGRTWETETIMHRYPVFATV